MFERTVLPAGPRVISARLPATRSVSVAAYVLAGSRLELPGQVGVAHFMEHLTFKGTTATRRPARSARRSRVWVARSTRRRTANRPSTGCVSRPARRTAPIDVIGELIVRPKLDHEDIASERAVIIEEIRSYLDDPNEYCQMLFQAAMFGDGPLGREICGEESDILALPAEAIHDFWRAVYRPANTVVAIVGDLDHARAVTMTAAAMGTGNGPVPGYSPAPALPAGSRSRLGKRDTTQAQVVLGVPGLRRDHPDAWTLAVLNAVLGDGMSSRLFLSVREELGPRLRRLVGPGRVRRRGLARGLGGRRSGRACRRPSKRSSPSSLGCATNWSRPPSSTRPSATSPGGLELRMDDTRHVASWIGGQEALHDRVLTLDEALAAIETVDAAAIQRLATELFRDEACASPSSRRRATCVAWSAPAAAG